MANEAEQQETTVSTIDVQERLEAPTVTEAPPAYTPYCSSGTLSHNNFPVIDSTRYTRHEKTSLRIIAITSIILGTVSIFISTLSIIFGTMMYCTGTGMWGGLLTTFNGVFILLRYGDRNTKCQSISMTVFSIATVVASITSVALAVSGTTNKADNICCITRGTTGNEISCNIVASQISNTSVASLSFVQMVFAVMAAVFHSKYAFVCCNGGNDNEYNDTTPALYLDPIDHDTNMRYRLW